MNRNIECWANGQEHEGLFFVILLARSLVGASLSLYVSFTCIRCAFCNMCVMFVCPYMCMYCVADYKRGFGGKYGVEVERQDQCALGYEHKENLAKHESQKGTDTFLSTSPNPTLPFTKLLLILPFLWKVLPLSFFGWLWQKPLPLPQWHTHLCSTDWDFWFTVINPIVRPWRGRGIYQTVITNKCRQ